MITDQIGAVAYKLKLPEHARIHNVFHVSLLKKHVGPAPSEAAALPSDFVGARPLIKPVAVLDRRTILVHGQPVPQILVQWSDLLIEDASWENIVDVLADFPSFALEDKGVFEARGNDTKYGQAEPSNSSEKTMRRSNRARRIPDRYKE